MAPRVTPSKGRKSDKQMRDALIVALHRECEAADGKKTKRLYQVAEQLVLKAASGDVPAIKEVFDRVDGKSVQPLEGTDDGPPIQQVIRWLR